MDFTKKNIIFEPEAIDPLTGNPHSSKSVRENKEIIKEILVKNGMSLRYVNLDFLQTYEEKKELVKEAILSNHNALEFAPDECKDDRSIVKKAI